MSDKSDNMWRSMSDKALIRHIGAFIRYHRLSQNMTQEELALNAGISRSTLSLLERGEIVTLATLIQVLRVLDQLKVLDAFTVHHTVSPLILAKLDRQKRKRAGKSKEA